MEAALWVAERPHVPMVAGTPGEQMCRAAARFADAIMTWLSPASDLADVVLPAARAGAVSAGRPAPGIVAAVPAALARDSRAALDGLNRAFGGVARAPSYRAMPECAGIGRAAGEGGFSEVVLDAIVAWGDEHGLEARVRELAEAGADEVVLWPFMAGDDPAASLAAMQGLAAL